MLEEGIWLKRLAREAKVELETSQQLWTVFVALLIERLEQGERIDLSSLGIWSLKFREEYAVETEDGIYLLPPKLNLEIHPPGSGPAQTLGAFVPTLVEATRVLEESIQRWLQLIPSLLIALLEANYTVWWQGIGHFEKQEGISVFTPSLEFDQSINKSFLYFKPELLRNELVLEGLVTVKLARLEDLNEIVSIHMPKPDTVSRELKPMDASESARAQEAIEEEANEPRASGDLVEEELEGRGTEPEVMKTESMLPAAIEPRVIVSRQNHPDRVKWIFIAIFILFLALIAGYMLLHEKGRTGKSKVTLIHGRSAGILISLV